MQREIPSFNKGIVESNIKTLSDYYFLERKRYDLRFWVGGKLIPYHLKDDAYQWVVFPFHMEIGDYRLCFTVNMGKKRFPIFAFAVIYPESVKPFPAPSHHLVGIGFKFSPLCVTNNEFTFSSNLTDFTVREDGNFNICVTASNWAAQVSNTSFELLLLKKRI